jgi:predicted DNA-binding transcriptional regulator AlpA
VRIINRAEVCRKVADTDYSSIFRWWQAGDSPVPITIGTGHGIRTKIGWYEHEVDEWCENWPRRGTKWQSERQELLEIADRIVRDLLDATPEERQDFKRRWDGLLMGSCTHSP